MENLSNFDNSTVATDLTRSKGGIVTDEHQFPFSLFNAIKHNHSVKMATAGDVSEVMDKTIGRIVYKIKGSVSANNYLSVENFVLLGPILYIQYCLLKPNIATIHLEVVTISNMSFRISLSTLYDNDAPKFLGRSLRMPLPLVSGWMTLEIDIREVLSEFCGVLGQQNPHHKELKHIKKVQICSNMVIRDVVSADHSVYVDGKTNAKELTVKPQCDQVPCIDMVEYCLALQQGNRNQYLTEHNIDIHLHPVQSPMASPAGHITKSPSTLTPLKNSKFSPFNKSSGEKKREERPTTASKGKTVVEAPSSSMRVPATPADENKNYALAFADSTAGAPRTPMVGGPTPPPPPSLSEAASDIFNKSELDTTNNAYGSRVNFASMPVHNTSVFNTNSPIKSTIRSPIIPTSDIIKYNRVASNPNERVLKLERILGYRGGPAVLLYQGRMLVYSAGAHLVMVDLYKSIPEQPAPKIPNIGLWKAFGNDFQSSVEGYRQAFLKGHADEVGLIEISASEQYMATVEKSKENPLVIIWDIKEGNRIASFRPYKHEILSISFHHYLSQIVTVGLDSQFRHQIIIWDIRNLTLQKGIVTNPEALQTCTIAKQISEFSITKISYIPFMNQNNYEENNQLISCGRENIRLWRVRKHHLPGRPILLNDYSRGYAFTEIAFDTVTTAATASNGNNSNANGMRSPTSTAVITPTPNVTAPLIAVNNSQDPTKKGSMKPLYYIYVASNHGLILRINYLTEQILCAFQLHATPIRSFRIQNGYSVTGGEDSKLRIWPLDFQDFLLEARHEGAVTNIYINNDGKQQIIGTNAGTLGLLNVLEHSYETILRSHTAAITQIQYNHYAVAGTVSTPTSSQKKTAAIPSREIVTIGKDRTIRIWDIQTASQNVEFLSEMDEPACVAFHPTTLPNYHSVVVGFQSGILRVFDVTSALSILERKIHAYPIIKLEVFTSLIEKGKIYCCTVDNHGYLMIHEIVNHQQLIPVANVHLTNHTFESLSLCIHSNTGVLAVGYDTVESIQLFRIPDLLPFSPLSPLPAYVSNAGIEVSDDHEDENEEEKQPENKSDSLKTPTKSYNELFGKTNTTTATFRAGYVSSSPNSPSHNALQSPLIGMCFLTEDITSSNDNTRMTLLITTEKHFYVFSMVDPFASAMNLGMTAVTATTMNPSTTTNPSLQWEQRASKRIDFGVPTSMQRDPKTGLIGLAIKVPMFGSTGSATVLTTSTLVTTGPSHTAADTLKITMKSTTTTNNNHASTTKINEHAFNSFALINIRFMKSDYDYKEKLYFSVPQVYQGLPGNISDLAFCFPYMKVITVDANGCMTFWKIQEEQCARLLQDSSLSQTNMMSSTQDKVIPMHNQVVNVVSSTTGKELDDYIAPRELSNNSMMVTQSMVPDRYGELVASTNAVDLSTSIIKPSSSVPVPAKSSNKGNDFAFMFEEEEYDDSNTPPPPPPALTSSMTFVTQSKKVDMDTPETNAYAIPKSDVPASVTLEDFETVKKETESIDESIQKVQSLFASLKTKGSGENKPSSDIPIAASAAVSSAKSDSKKVLDLTDLYSFDKKSEGGKSVIGNKKEDGTGSSKLIQSKDFEIRRSNDDRVLQGKDNFDHLFGDDDQDMLLNDDDDEAAMTSHHILSSYETLIAKREETMKELGKPTISSSTTGKDLGELKALAGSSSRIVGVSTIPMDSMKSGGDGTTDPISQLKLDIYTPPIHCPTAKAFEKFKLLRSITSNTSAGYENMVTDIQAPQLVYGLETLTGLVMPPNRYDFFISTDGKSIYYNDIKTNQQYTLSCQFPSIFPMHEIKQLVCHVSNLAIAPASQGVTAVLYLPSKHINLVCYWKLMNQLLIPYSILPLDLKNDPVLKSERIHSVEVDYSEVAFLHNDLIMLLQGNKAQGSPPIAAAPLHQQNTPNVAFQLFQLSIIQVLPNFSNAVLCQHRLTIPGNGIYHLQTWYTTSSVYGILHTSSSCVVIDIPIAAKEPSQLRQPPRVIWLDDLKAHGQFLGHAFTACKTTSPGSTSDSLYATKGILVAITSLGTLHVTTFDTIVESHRSSVTFASTASITRSKLVARTTEITLPVINTLTLAEIIRLDIQEISENHYHLAISLDDKLHFYLLKIKELSKKSIQAAMFNHQQSTLSYVPMTLSFYHPHIQLKRSSKPTKFPVPLVMTSNGDCNIGFVGNTTNHFPMINSRNYFELRSPVPTLMVKGILQIQNLDNEELMIVITSTHIHPYHTATGMKLPAYAFREGFRCTTITSFENSSAMDTTTTRPWIAIGCTNGHVLLYNAHTFEEMDSWCVYSSLSSSNKLSMMGTNHHNLISGELIVNGKRLYSPSMIAASSSSSTGHSIASLAFTPAHASSKELVGITIMLENGEIFLGKLIEVVGNPPSVDTTVATAATSTVCLLKYLSQEHVTIPSSIKMDIAHAMISHHNLQSYSFATVSLNHPSHQSVQGLLRKPIGVLEILDTPFLAMTSNTPNSAILTRRLFIRALLPAYNQEEALIPSSYFPTDEAKLLEQTDTLMIDTVHLSDWSNKQWLVTIIGKFAHISISKDTWLFTTTINHSSLLDVKHIRGDGGAAALAASSMSMSYDPYDPVENTVTKEVWESYVYLSKRVNLGQNQVITTSFYQQYAAIWVATQQIYLVDVKANQGKKELLQSIDEAAFRVIDLSYYSFGMSSAPPLEMAFHNKLVFYAQKKGHGGENAAVTVPATTAAAGTAAVSDTIIPQEYYLLLSEFARPSKIGSIKLGKLPY